MEDVTIRQLKRLAESLAAMRKSEDADVVLLCDEKEFPAHKLVLKASCPYFKGMFESNMKEATADEVVIHQVKADAMEAVLDYLYLGKIPEIKNSDLVINLIEAAHLFQLTELLTYSCDNLDLWISEKNVYKMLNIALLYDLNMVLKSVLDYVTINIDQILADPKFLNLPYLHLRGLLNNTMDRVQISEELLIGIINWICQDANNREMLADELFKYINLKHLRREFMKLLIDSQDVRNISVELCNKIQKLALDVFYELSEFSFTEHCDVARELGWKNRQGARLVIFSKQRIVIEFDPNINCFVKRKVSYSCIQHLDLYTMTWLPAIKLPFSGFENAAMCQHKHLIYIVGGRLESKYVMYDVSSNTAEFVTCNHFNRKEGGQLLPIVDHIYFVDENYNVSQLTPGEDRCVVPYFSVLPTWISPKIFATSTWVYVTYYENVYENKTLKMKRFLCNNGQFTCQCLIPVQNIPVGTPVSFTVSKISNIMYGFCVENNKLIRVSTTNAKLEDWTIEVVSACSNVLDMNTLYNVWERKENALVFVTTEDDNQLRIPRYQLEPETCEWIRLPLPKRKCELSDLECNQKVYFLQDLQQVTNRDDCILV